MSDPIAPPKQKADLYDLSLDLVCLYDDFVEYQDTCAFFCDAVTSMLSIREEFGDATLEGINGFSDHIKQNGGKLRERFLRAHEKCREGLE